jgi:hypothetical protein
MKTSLRQSELCAQEFFVEGIHQQVPHPLIMVDIGLNS